MSGNEALLLPYRPEVTRRAKLWLPESARERKIVAFKAKIAWEADAPWVGAKLRCDRDRDIREPDHTGRSVLDQIHLWLTGMLERHHGEFVFQDGDRMQAITYLEEWPEREDSEERWARFFNRRPPRRDSPDD